VDSEGMTLGISYGIPLYDSDGTFVGIVDADFSLNDLSKFLQSIKIGKTGVAALTTSDGKLLAASSNTPIVTSSGQRISADKSPDPLIVAAASFVVEAESVRATHAEAEVDSAVYYLRASPIGRELGLNWTLVTIIPEKDFTAEIEAEFQRSWTASLIAVAVAVVVGLAAARWLITPLITLVTAVRRIGQGDLETRVQIRHAPEYTKLADEINEMTLGLQDRMRMRHSLALAMDVQQALLPSDSPQVEGLDISGHSTYCDETGGDYYDFLDVTDLGEQSVCVALGDVMGHGVAAAMLMATARGILRSHCQEPRSLADLLNHMNELLVPDTGGERFMTMLLMTLDAEKRVLRWASAGHDPPFIVDPQAGTYQELEGSGLPLGLVEEGQYESYEYTAIRPGQVLFAATDGVWEMQNSQDEQFGKQRLRELLIKYHDEPAEVISQAIRDALHDFRGDGAPDDDVTFVIVVVT
jgi:sigma-B regulation protein RsbU (phosphoserine phosphatase)